jgi:hypothetical protein
VNHPAVHFLRDHSSIYDLHLAIFIKIHSRDCMLLKNKKVEYTGGHDPAYQHQAIRCAEFSCISQ